MQYQTLCLQFLTQSKYQRKKNGKEKGSDLSNGANRFRNEVINWLKK